MKTLKQLIPLVFIIITIWLAVLGTYFLTEKLGITFNVKISNIHELNNREK